jgi:regulator of sigma E protease
MNLPFLVTLGTIWSKAWPFLIAILFFGVIIFIHEFGHFIFAKLFGVRVNEFALGMGPTLLKKQGKETKYALHLFPIGGYCAMEGEDEESEDERAFCNKKLWQRMIIVAAGATFNLILGVVICCILVGTDGDYVGTRTILRFHETAISNSEGGLMPGDEILRIDGKRVFSDYDVTFLMQRNNTGKYHMVVRRDGKKVDLPAVPFQVRTGGNFSYAEDNTIGDLSARMKKAGLKNGDRILAVNGEAVADNAALAAAIGADRDFVIDYTVERDGETLDVNKVKMMTVTVFDFVILGEKKTVFSVLGGGVKYALTMSRLVYLSLFDLIRGHYGLSELAGPIGTVSVIANVAQESVQTADWSGIIMIMAMITINIGLFNLLPIPALDGGRLFFMFIELIFRKPIPAKYEGWVHAVGMVLLLAFMAVISASDIWKWISGVGFY